MAGGPHSHPSDDSLVTRAAYVVFQGGGARAYAHIGGLAALEELDVALLGVAGTSAGAFLAAFTAVGYSADEMLNPNDPEDHLLRRININSPVELFDKRRWKLLAILKRAWKSRLRKRWWPAMGGSMFSLALQLLLRRGIFDSKEMVRAVDDLLRLRINEWRQLDREFYGGSEEPLPAKRLVQFGDLKNQPGAVPLKIVVVDVSRNRVVVFSTDDTPEASIAQAVVASAAAPGLFRLCEVAWAGGESGSVYADGGLASNLPIWVFSDERHFDARRIAGVLPTIGFTLEDEHASDVTSVPGLLNRLKDVVLSTGQQLLNPLVDSLMLVPLPTQGITFLDLDATLADVAAVVARAETAARKILNANLLTSGGLARASKLLELGPREARGNHLSPAEGIYLALANAKTIIENDLERIGCTEYTRLRVCCIEPIRSRYGKAPIRNFRVVQTVGFSDDADDRMMLDGENRCAPRAFHERGLVMWPRTHEKNMSKYERALLPASLRSAICIPVFEGGSQTWNLDPAVRPDVEPVGIFSLDADIDLTPFVAEIQETLLQVSQFAWEVFAARQVQRGLLSAPHHSNDTATAPQSGERDTWGSAFRAVKETLVHSAQLIWEIGSALGPLSSERENVKSRV